ncbi:DoxX [Rubripirellula lacrimiformis]|uniref:DoxX n=1 Tax=Rubripirellula lacrimiformis TaxID=1930273 RepID=A0A517ND13_9BACT|nr:DoxX family membrane protein [Rubripirellula lacrimiformis]QDT05013.1 DoxX [Rubripirellula lacrimiformis]
MFVRLSIVILALIFIAAGVNHFVSPDVYLKIMPDYLPWPLALVYVSGFFEVLGGIGLAVSRLRRLAGWGLIALLLAVFPANVDMVLNADRFPQIPVWALLARLPMQGLLIAWVWWTAVKQVAISRVDDSPGSS